MGHFISKLRNLMTWKVDSVVEEDGWYICVPCGYKRYLKSGMHFPRCVKCLGKEKRSFLGRVELWEHWRRTDVLT